MGLTVELERFPVVICRLTDASGSAELEGECSTYLKELTTHRGIFVCVHDWTDPGELSSESWRLVFERLVLDVGLASRCVAQAIAVSSPSLRGFATASSMQHRTPYPVRVASSLETAISWCTWQLRRSEPQAV
jgi:hypothetical protein